MWNQKELAHEIARMLSNQLLEDVDIEADLIESGALDSVAVVRLLPALEEHFGVDLPLEDLALTDLRSVKTIAELVDRAMRLPLQEEMAEEIAPASGSAAGFGAK
ncbi:MAG TPA: acyl carrier protein [Bryobacteraceae bacterium]|nr:acyl carrier protein [Bryobacteraceae bacterium]